MLLGSLDLSMTKSTTIKNITSGRIALTPPMISAKGVFDHLEISVEENSEVEDAKAKISSTEMVCDTWMAKIRTAIIGNNEAIVTTPKPEREESPFPADAAIPIPNERTSGTVTGPVVTAPQSQASPNIVLRSGLLQAYAVSKIVGVNAK